MRKFFTWFLILIVLGVGGLTGAYFLAKKYEEPVRNYIVGEVNKRLQSPVHVSDINFSLLERFPSASLVMDSVWAEENLVKIGEPDTLFFFRKVYLNLNLFDIIDGQYKINEIETRDGFMRLLVDENGYDNYHIWVTSQDSTGFLLELDKVHIETTDFRYENRLRRQIYDLNAEDMYFNGRFSNENYTMSVKGQGHVNDISIKGTSYLGNRDVAVESELDIVTETQHYGFRNGHILIDDVLDFGVTGSFEKDGIDLKIAGHELDIIKALSLLPSGSVSAFDQYESAGFLTFDCTLKGVFGKTENPALQAKFSFQNASISKKGSNWSLTQLYGNGDVSNGSAKNFATTTLNFPQLKGKLNGDDFQANFSVKNLIQPTIEGRAQLDSDIEGLTTFVPVEGLEAGTGRIAIDATINTTLKNPSDSKARDFLNAEASGTVRIEDAQLKLSNDFRDYAIDTAVLSIQNNALVIDEYRGRINDCSVKLDGRANGFLNYFFSETGILDITGNIEVGVLNLEELFPTRDSDDDDASVVVAFPQRARWKLHVLADRFQTGKFIAEDVSGNLGMDAFKVEATNLDFNSQEGAVSGRIGLYRFAENQFGLRTKFEATDVDSKTLFQTFNEFGQDFITSDVLQGDLSANIEFQAFCDSVFSIQTQSIVSTIDIQMTKGGLTGFQPLIDIADEVKKKPMLRLFISVDELRKRLEDVQFDTLHNEITIRDGIITIPSMSIRSSAVNLNVSGTHTFDHKIDYQMDFALSEFLELNDRKEDYNEYVQRDDQGKTRLYLSMTGTTDDFEVNVKRTDFNRSVKEEIKSEKQTVKNLLNEEFGIFERDSSVHEETRNTIEIEFDPEASDTPADTLKKKDNTNDKSKGKKGLKKLLEKTETDKGKLEDGEFEDDDF